MPNYKERWVEHLDRMQDTIFPKTVPSLQTKLEKRSWKTIKSVA